jgi:hypothetical protein
VIRRTAALAALVLCAYAPAVAQPTPQNREVYEPVPPVVTPGKTDSAPPSDAIVLFDGKDLSHWVNTVDKKPARWKVEGGVLVVAKAAGDGDIETKETFTDYQLHIEWREPTNLTGKGQSRGNSGVFLASTGPNAGGYELQILDSYNNPTYVNGQAGAIYKQSIPLANAMRPPGEWQVYEVVWTAPRFNGDGSLKSPARVTVFHNGVLVQNNFAVLGETAPPVPVYKAHGPAPIKLQAHGDPSPPISFRNIWVRRLP